MNMLQNITASSRETRRKEVLVTWLTGTAFGPTKMLKNFCRKPLGRSKHTQQSNEEKEYEGIGQVSSGSGYGPVVGFCEHCNEHSGSISVRAKLSA
jgi:hypothetical protein